MNRPRPNFYFESVAAPPADAPAAPSQVLLGAAGNDFAKFNLKRFCHVSSPPFHGVAEHGLERGKVSQALLDILFVGVALLLISSVAVAIVGSLFILIFIRT